MRIFGYLVLIAWLLGLAGVIDFRVCIGPASGSCSRPAHTWSAPR